MLKKWMFVIGFVAFGLFAFGLEGNAAVPESDKTGAYFIYSSGGGTLTLVEKQGSLNFYRVMEQNTYGESQQLYVKGEGQFRSTVYSADGSIFNRSAWHDVNGTRAVVGGGFTLVDSTVTIYGDSDLQSVFFRAPNPFVMNKVTTVEEVPKIMKAQMVDGGIISTGLMVLAILLGVFLVPRLIYSFLR